MTGSLQQLESLIKQYAGLKQPVAIVVRPDIYRRLLRDFPRIGDEVIMFIGTPVLPDPAADSIAMAQTEECMMFYDHRALERYLKRGEEAIAWVKYCCEQANIPFPLEDEALPPQIE